MVPGVAPGYIFRGGGKRVRTSEKMGWGGYPLKTHQFWPICKLHWGHLVNFFFFFFHFFLIFPLFHLSLFLKMIGGQPPPCPTPMAPPLVGTLLGGLKSLIVYAFHISYINHQLLQHSHTIFFSNLQNHMQHHSTNKTKMDILCKSQNVTHFIDHSAY